jgi:diguanylate cyclase (GGDEF)-like protein
MHQAENDLLALQDSGQGSWPPADGVEPWRILIVDDDDQVHQVTRFALRDAVVLGRPLAFDSAYSAAEAREHLSRVRYACILLDVVMESDDAGLALVGEIRERFGDTTVRIVLRTGQPGHAPEIEVIQKYDINDYRSKSELTSQRLLTSLTAALRSYQQIRTIEANREGLRMILDAASSLMAVKAVRNFAEGVLTQVCAMLHIDPGGVVCLRSRTVGKELQILAASGPRAALQGEPAERLGDPQLLERVRRAVRDGESVFEPDHAVLHIGSPGAEQMLVYIPTGAPLGDLDRSLLELFSINVAIGLDNAHLFEELEVMAFHDRLTGLWNRTSLERELARRIRGGRRFSLLIADIDNFQAVNDGLGHDIGDRTLQASAALLAELFGADTFIARTSADSFALVVPDEGLEALTGRLAVLAKRLERNLRVDGHEVPLSMSLGVARFPEHGASANTLFQNAGIALKEAKRANRASFQLFDDRFERDLQQRLQTVRELRHAVERRNLRLLYQPQVVLSDRAIYAVEALIRWQREGDLLLTPDRFIPAAEDSGLIVGLGEWILYEACRQQQAWEHRLGRPLGVAVNVSLRQLTAADFLPMLRAVLAETAIEPRRLELEVTESMMVEDSARLVRILEEVRATGVNVAIDDFGTGYSSLSQLQRLPIDRLKIDRAFITGLTERKEDAMLVAMIVNLGHLLGLRVIAEGVETEAQRERLIELGCDDGQGYLFAPPLAPEELAGLLV